MLAGNEIAASDRVVIRNAAVGFDATVFDDPMRFDAGRPTPPPGVSFGAWGVHFCLGASLARLELVELIDELLDRDRRIDVVGEPEFVRSNFVNGIERLDVVVR